MRRLGSRLTVAILTFTVGIIAASVGWHFRSRPLAVVPVSERPMRTYIPKRHYDAARGALQTFGSSDGRDFEKWTITCGSPQGAKRKMEEILTRAEGIVIREPALDAEGHQTGEEVVAVFPDNDAENGAASLFHVGESEYLIQVRGSSLRNIIEYRNDFKH